MPFTLTGAEIDEVASYADEPIDYPLLSAFGAAAHAEGVSDAKRDELLLIRDALTLPAHMHSADVAHPYGVVGGMYSHERFTPEQAQDLAALAPTITHAEIRAAFADIAWLRNRGNPDLARLAVRSYIQSAKQVQDGAQWPPVIERAERALRLARSLGEEETTYREASDYLLELVRTYQGNDPLFLTSRAINLLLEFRIGAPSDYYAYALGAAERAEAAHKYFVARAYYEVLLRIARANRDEGAGHTALRQIAQTFVAEARHRESQGNHMAVAHFLTQAIQAYKRAPNSDQYVEPLRIELQKAERASLANFKSVSMPPINIADEIEKARKHVSGYPINEAVRRFALMFRIADLKEVRRQAEDAGKRFIARRLAAMSHVDDQGRIVGIERPENGDDPSFGALMEQAAYARNFNVQAYLVPALDQLMLEHDITLADMAELSRFSPFVPEQRELVFARGLVAAFSMDFLTATHILIPQIENSIRHLMQEVGIITTKMDRQGIQRQMDLGDLLLDQRIKDVLSDDIVFELRALLIDNRGPNLRHQVAHGMLNDNHFLTAETIYAFWLVLNLCLFVPHVRPQPAKPGCNSDNVKTEAM
jgi:hypothetical protein